MASSTHASHRGGLGFAFELCIRNHHRGQTRILHHDCLDFWDQVRRLTLAQRQQEREIISDGANRTLFDIIYLGCMQGKLTD